MHPYSIASIVTTFSITLVAAAMPNTAEVGSAEFQPFHRFDHRQALRAESQAIAINEEALALTRDVAACTITSMPLGLVGEVDLQLHRTSVVAADAETLIVGKDGIERPVNSGAATLWLGNVVGDEFSEVFLADSPAGLFGWIQTAGERWVITSGDPKGDRTTIIYPSMGIASAMIEWSPFECGTINRNEPQMDQFGPQDSGGGVAGNVCMTVEIAIDTDNAFLSMFGANEAAAQGYLETLVAGANVIFSRDAETQLSIVYSRLWNSADPWSGTSTGGRLDEFRDYWRSQMTSVSRDTAHLLSGENLGGGVAWTIGSVCSTNSSYAVSANLNGFFPTPLQEHSSQNWDIMVFTHELGHLFDSPHTHSYNPPIDNCGNGDCSDAFGGTIMSYCHTCGGGINNIELGFHPRVQDVMMSYLSSRWCVSDTSCGGIDTDFDGVGDDEDNCPDTPNGNQADADGDDVGDACDGCPNDPLKTEPGSCGCGVPDSDDNGDGVPDCLDGAFDVPDDFPTIQAAIDAAPTSAVINVAAGTWPITDTIDLLGKAITVHGATDSFGNPATIVDGQGAVLVFSCESSEGSDTVLENLEITGGNSSGSGGGVNINGSGAGEGASPSFNNCIFRGNASTNGGGVYVRGTGSAPIFQGCSFIDNSASNVGGGMYVRQTSAPKLLNCVFANNTATVTGGAIGNQGTATVSISGSVICGNSEDVFSGNVSEGAGNCTSTACSDKNADGNPDACSDGSSCLGDYDGDGQVAGSDLGSLLAAWGTNSPALDLDGNTVINGGDLGLLLSAWGSCP